MIRKDFNTDMEFKEFLEKIGYDSRTVIRIIDHQYQHRQEATKRGYDSYYIFEADNKGPAYKLRIGENGKKITIDDALAILSAPRELDKIDQESIKIISQFKSTSMDIFTTGMNLQRVFT